MAHRIFKFPFLIYDVVEIEMPANARILHVDVQRETPCLWAVVDTDAPRISERFRVFGTGHVIEDESRLEHVATFFQNDGWLVWHMFKEKA